MYRRLVWCSRLLAMAGSGGRRVVPPASQSMRITFHVVGADGAPIVGTPDHRRDLSQHPRRRPAEWPRTVRRRSPGRKRPGHRHHGQPARGASAASRRNAAPTSLRGAMRARHTSFANALSWGAGSPGTPPWKSPSSATQKPVAMYGEGSRPQREMRSSPKGRPARRLRPHRRRLDRSHGQGHPRLPRLPMRRTREMGPSPTTQPFEVSLLLGFSNKGDGIQAGSQPHATETPRTPQSPATTATPTSSASASKESEHPVDAGVSLSVLLLPRPHPARRTRKSVSAPLRKIDGDIEFSPTAPGRLKFKILPQPHGAQRPQRRPRMKNSFGAPALTPAPPAAPVKDAASEKEATVP